MRTDSLIYNVDRSLKWKKKQEQASTPAAELPAENPSNFAISWHHSDLLTTDKSTASSFSIQQASDYAIANCWILDAGSNIHVCNDPSRFKTTHPTTSADYLISGSTRYPIQAYGNVDITITSPAGDRKTITLH